MTLANKGLLQSPCSWCLYVYTSLCNCEIAVIKDTCIFTSQGPHFPTWLFQSFSCFIHLVYSSGKLEITSLLPQCSQEFFFFFESWSSLCFWMNFPVCGDKFWKCGVKSSCLAHMEGLLKYFVREEKCRMTFPGRRCRTSISLLDFHFQIGKWFKLAVKTIDIKWVSETWFYLKISDTGN